MNYKRAYAIAFQHPDWMKSLLLLAVCVLIPIVGVMVILGYRAELMDRWIDDDSDERQKPFDFNRFTELLTRGAWPFLYQLIVGMVFGVIMMVMYFVLLMAMIATKEPAVFFVGILFFYLCLFVIQIFITMITWPFTLHGQVSGKFDFGGAWAFAKDFYSRVGVFNLFGISLLFTILNALCSFAGLALFCVGVYAAVAVIMMADNHLLWQLYRKYLNKGGRTLPRFEGSAKAESERNEDPIDPVYPIDPV